MISKKWTYHHAIKVCDYYLGQKKFCSRHDFFKNIYDNNWLYEEMKFMKLTDDEWNKLVERYLVKSNEQEKRN